MPAFLTIKDAHPHISNHPTHAKKVQAQIEMNAADWATFLAMSDLIATNEVSAATLAHIARANLIEGSS